MTTPVIYFLGDVHGNFDHVIDAVDRDSPDAVIFLGDLEAQNPLHQELAPILSKTVVRYIHGNHDTDSDEQFRNVFASDVAHLNIHGRVEDVCGIRIAGLGGIFRSSAWLPPGRPVIESYSRLLEALNASRPRRERTQPRIALSNQERLHRSTIFYDTYAHLMHQQADVLVSHEAPSAHPHGFAAIDDLARAMGVKTAFHGHHHDRRDYSGQWERSGFKTFGVGFCGITALDGRVITPGDFD
jgi:predicted phosphodiesterase